MLIALRKCRGELAAGKSAANTAGRVRSQASALSITARRAETGRHVSAGDQQANVAAEWKPQERGNTDRRPENMRWPLRPTLTTRQTLNEETVNQKWQCSSELSAQKVEAGLWEVCLWPQRTVCIFTQNKGWTGIRCSVICQSNQNHNYFKLFSSSLLKPFWFYCIFQTHFSGHHLCVKTFQHAGFWFKLLSSRSYST